METDDKPAEDPTVPKPGFAKSVEECQHERTQVKCPDCGIQFPYIGPNE